MKNNLSFYPRRTDSHRHPKMKLLRVKYGREGRDKFWHLCDLIAEADNCYLDVSTVINKASIAEDLEFTIEQFDTFIECLFKDCELIKIENQSITTDTAQEALSLVMKDRKGSKERYEKKKKPTSPEKPKTSDENLNTSPVSRPIIDTNEMKLNESKSTKAEILFQYYIGNEEILSIHECFKGKFPILLQSVSKNYGESRVKKWIEEFSNLHNQKQWKDFQDFRTHITNYLKMQSIKQLTISNSKTLTAEQHQQLFS